MLIIKLMVNARVGLFENDSNMLFLANWGIQREGHAVLSEATAGTTEEAFSVLEAIAAGQIAVDALVLDGNLEEGADDGHDAVAIAGRMRELGILVPTIGFSSKPFSHYGVEVTLDLGKKPQDLGTAISSLEPAVAQAA